MNIQDFLNALGEIDEEFIVDLLSWIVEPNKPNRDDCEMVSHGVPE